MRIDKVKLIYFSPTGSTKKILEYIAEGIHASHEHIDLTKPDFAAKGLNVSGQELAIIGIPVYVGRVPRAAANRLMELKGNNTPTALVVVYGNRAYEDALLELSDLTTGIGFKPLAGAAFVAEHSFSSPEVPIAPGRPDELDRAKAVEFGKQIRQKLEDVNVKSFATVEFPGQRPYRTFSPGGERPKSASPDTDEDKCTKCGRCGEACPTGAITVGPTVTTNKDACIRCHACVKVCPPRARVMLDPWFVSHTKILHDRLVNRMEPETFL
jgi:ferredoxin/flavodoxin